MSFDGKSTETLREAIINTPGLFGGVSHLVRVIITGLHMVHHPPVRAHRGLALASLLTVAKREP